MEPELLRIEEVARRLGLSRSKTYALAASTALPTVRVGGSIRVRRADLDVWLANLPGSGTAATTPVEGQLALLPDNDD